jgi:RHS repeat-associated protein
MQPASSTRITDGFMAAMRLGGEKPHQGLPGENPAPNPVREVCKFTVLLGMRGQAELNRAGSCCTGKERDTESGNDYFGARYYASSMGRFMSPDSPGFAHLSNPQAWNLYAYTYNNPVSSVDPDGHDVACSYNITQCAADANTATNGGGRVTTTTTVTHHSLFGIHLWDSSVTKLAISGDEASFRALGQNASRLADLIDNHSFTLDVQYRSYDPVGGSNSIMLSQHVDGAPSVIIDPTRPGGNYDSDATEAGIPQATSAEEFGHEVLGHQWGELINGDNNANGNGVFAPTTRANMRDAITGENAVRKLDPARGQKGIFDHHSYSEAPSDGYTPPDGVKR